MQKQKHCTKTDNPDSPFFFSKHCGTLSRSMYCKHHDKKNQMFHPKQDPIGFECLYLSEERNVSLTSTKLALGAEQMKEHKTWVKQTNLSKTDLLPTGRNLCRATLCTRLRFYSFAIIFHCRKKQKRLILQLFQTSNFNGLYDLQLPLLSKFEVFFALHLPLFHSPIIERVRKVVIKLLTLQCYNDDTILQTCHTLTD